MNKMVAKLPVRYLPYLLLGVLSCNSAVGALLDTQDYSGGPVDVRNGSRDDENTYVASNNSVQQLFFVIGGALNKPFVVSTEAAKNGSQEISILVSRRSC